MPRRTATAVAPPKTAGRRKIAARKPAKPAAEKAACRKCRPKKYGEEFRFKRTGCVFDVDLAREIVADGREPFELDEPGVRACVESCEVDERHVLHVDPTIPGIVAHVWKRDAAGVLVRGHRLIDGHHRAARCLLEGRPCLAYVLDETESRRVLTESPFRESDFPPSA